MIILLEKKEHAFLSFYLPAWFIIRDEEIDRCYITFQEREREGEEKDSFSCIGGIFLIK